MALKDWIAVFILVLMVCATCVLTTAVAMHYKYGECEEQVSGVSL